ncbi:head-tail adaptor protein [Herbiconiux moechotypicola]|uniref:Head-to-tail stopper n=1 Tax=Herbiconiux moechotypicola TaxID=637393 RepID=A0ABP5QAW8_9MICO|nr:head-tail adaptor protein [Herbiconiux moechotypicola]MCS5729488.1 head-tail adaptor protein [Herbiconiux moechotypicola]
MILTGYRKRPAVYRLRPGTVTDSYGDPVESWTSPVRAAIPFADFSTRDADEDETSTGSSTSETATLTIRGVFDLTEEDRVEVDGLVWRVDGPPSRPTGFIVKATTVASLTRTKGRPTDG